MGFRFRVEEGVLRLTVWVLLSLLAYDSAETVVKFVAWTAERAQAFLVQLDSN